MPVPSLACHLRHNTPNIPSRYNNEQTTKQTKAINNSYIYINISCKCDTNHARHFTLDAYASRPVACLISLRTKMNRGVSSWNISVCFDYNIKVLWLTSNRCWADVGGRRQPNVETTLGRHRTADIDPTSAQDMFSCIFFFHSIICQNYFAPKSSQCWKQRSILVQFLAWL